MADGTSTSIKSVPNLRQLGLFGTPEPETPPEPHPGVRRFICGDRDGLMLGAEPLDAYLRSRGQGWVVDIAELIDGLDLSELEAGYPGGGRPAFHPRILLGLILYGMSKGSSSLRDLERLAIVDLGAWWICRGLQPDHTTLCRFVLRHVDRLGEAFFVQVMKNVMPRLNLSVSEVAGDGTVIESAASRFRTMTQEAAEKQAQELRDQNNPTATASAEDMEAVARVAAERGAKRAAKGIDGSTVRVAPSDPDAVLQKQKNGTIRPSYKPSVLATPQRLVLGLYLHASNEAEAIGPMIDQAETVLGGPVPTLLLDAGYFTEAVITLSLERDIDLLCPSGALDKTGEVTKQSREGKLIKSDFAYDEASDTYECPEGKVLAQVDQGVDRHGSRYRRYFAPAEACAKCPRRAECTSSKTGRSVKRYEIDDAKESMTEVLRQPAARARYNKRQGMVEPVFGDLRETQGLRRFRRRGRKKVRAEFVLHVVAYNLRRALRLGAAISVVTLWGRTQDGPWRPLIAWLAITRD